MKYQYSQVLAAAHEAAQPAFATQLELVAGADHGDLHGPPPTLNARAAGSYVALLAKFLF